MYQTLKNHPSRHPKHSVRNFFKCLFQEYNGYFSPQYNFHGSVYGHVLIHSVNTCLWLKSEHIVVSLEQIVRPKNLQLPILAT